MGLEEVLFRTTGSLTSWLQDTPDLDTLVSINPCTNTVSILVWIRHKASMGEKSPSRHFLIGCAHEAHVGACCHSKSSDVVRKTAVNLAIQLMVCL